MSAEPGFSRRHRFVPDCIGPISPPLAERSVPAEGKLHEQHVGERCAEKADRPDYKIT